MARSSSPGAFGFYPWIDASKTYYGLVARLAIGSALESVYCGRMIRKAWVTVREHPLRAVAVVGRSRSVRGNEGAVPIGGQERTGLKVNMADPQVVAAVGENETSVAVAAIAPGAVAAVAGRVELEVGDRSGGYLDLRQDAQRLAACEADEKRSRAESEAEHQYANADWGLEAIWDFSFRFSIRSPSSPDAS